MATLICASCGSTFEGRPNRLYCSPDCRRAAEMKVREIKRKERLDAWLASLSPEERASYDDFQVWIESLPSADEAFPELKPWDDLPGTTWDELAPWEPIKEPPAKGKKGPKRAGKKR